MEKVLQSLEKNLEFELGEEQRTVLLSVFNFFENKDLTEAALIGAAGTGKTTVTKLIIQYLEQITRSYTIAAPTHKARKVISETTERNVVTIHQLLKLKPSIDILELDFRDLRFNSNQEYEHIPHNGVLLVDESSMINEVLFDHIVNACKEYKCQVLFIGDAAQLQPVKDHKLSKFTRVENKFTLNKIYRQAEENPILATLTELRTKHKRFFPELNSENGSLILYESWQELLKNNIFAFQDMVETENPNRVKLLAYTNKRVTAFNQVIRKMLFNNTAEYNIGDILMAYDSCEVDARDPSDFRTNKSFKHKLYNSNDYIVRSISEEAKFIHGILVKGFELELYDVYEYMSVSVFVLSKDNDPKVFEHLAASLEELRINAIQTTNKSQKNKYWVDYFKLNAMFLTPIDLIYDNRIVKSRSIGYGYCLTTHKSQGSSFDTVLVDMGNILRCTDAAELRQLQYVALSRTRKDVHMLTK
jgi:exodeoxyribonuclease-5